MYSNWLCVAMPMSLQTASLEELKRRERLNSSLWEQRVRLERGEPQFSASEFPQAPPSKHWQEMRMYSRNRLVYWHISPRMAGTGV